MVRCKSCRAEIVWSKTESGKIMPLDAELTDDGPMILAERPDDGEIVAVHRSKIVDFTGEEDAAYWPGRTSHFATCPNAGQHRRKR